METSLLKTKLNIPPFRPQMVPRPRLIGRLKEGLSYNLVLVSAPAGFGKTTLLSELARISQPQVRTAWVSLDEGDSDPVRFWDYFIAALKTIQPNIGETSLRLLHSPERSPTESILTPLLNDMAAILNDFTLVLDDYHLIKTDVVQQGMTFLLDHLPPRMHLVIATRVDPALPLSRFRGRGVMLEIGAADLRFTFEEATSLLREMLGPALSVEHVKTLNERTEGWAVGLRLAALSIGERKDVDSFIRSFTGTQRYIMDYLLEEVLKQQTEDVRDFLLKTSILERFVGPLCDSLTGRGGSQQTLAKLESSFVGFLIPLDESRQWYRYHHLFAELLRHELEVMSDIRDLYELHRRASQWYEDNGYPVDAVQHAVAVRDWERAIKLIYPQTDGYIKRGEFGTLYGWFQAIPERLLRSHPRLYAQYARILISMGSLDAAEAVLHYLEETADTSARSQGELAFYRTLLANRQGNIGLRIESAERALALLPPEELHMRALMSFHLGLVRHNQSRFDEARLLLTNACEMARQVGDYWIHANAAGRLSNILYLQGRLRESLTAAQEAVSLVGHSPAAIMPLVNVFLAQYERNDLPKAVHTARLGVELCEIGGKAYQGLDFNFWLAFALLAEGDITGANVAMEKADETDHLLGGLATHMAARVLFDILRSDLEAALEWANRLAKYPEGTLDAGWQHVPVRMLIASGEKTAAVEKLRALYNKTIQSGAYGCLIRIRLYQALVAATVEEALVFLTEALERGEPEGYTRTLADEGELLAPLLRLALDRGIVPQYTARLLDVIETENIRRRAAKVKEASVSPTSIGLLSRRELEVLQLVAEGLSNQQIAVKLTISLNTAKKHVSHIFDKLDTKDRLQAVNRAKELKLI